jgi:hypothetical protein
MAEMRDIRNSGIIVGGNVADSRLAVGKSGSVDGAVDDAELLKEIDELLSSLVSRAENLPEEQAAAVASDAMRLKQRLTAKEEDRGKIREALNKLISTAAGIAPLAEFVAAMTELATRLVH